MFVHFILQYGCLCEDCFDNQTSCGIMFNDVVVTKYGINTSYRLSMDMNVAR